MFSDDTNSTLNIDGLYTPKLKDMSSMFYSSWYDEVSIKNWNTSTVTNMEGLFTSCDRMYTAYLDLDMSNLATNGGKEMFSYCNNLTELTLMGKPSTKTGVYTDMFKNITTEGTLFYNKNYNYSRIIEQLPSTWTSEAI